MGLRCNHLREKIQGCVQRGGVADPDAPPDQKSIRYRCSLEITEEENQEKSTGVHTTGQLHNADALAIHSMSDQPRGASVACPDPLALVRRELQSLEQVAASPATPSVSAPRSQGLSCFRFFFALLLEIVSCKANRRQEPSPKQQGEMPRFLPCLKLPWLAKQWRRKFAMFAPASDCIFLTCHVGACIFGVDPYFVARQ